MEQLRQVPDSRIDRTRRHELLDMLHGQQQASIGFLVDSYVFGSHESSLELA